jgi:hypothetical protein
VLAFGNGEFGREADLRNVVAQVLLLSAFRT